MFLYAFYIYFILFIFDYIPQILKTRATSDFSIVAL